ncbi:uncharacterized protein BX663DRAFT_554965 [Cokeromyces recurvatus]|uniref:uncharacterized protein n=1 Tax=Cokeromyces recurvatus TaxID=90255 RepID=UPI002220F774|nr:uncharacterized protein BX663DRAFT_554965 [Cokeromyces recurvatus]KAI7899324.1 hypothetical protein BX663DRAFT_554965 [Cokeromyces recurvatus]
MDIKRNQCQGCYGIFKNEKGLALHKMRSTACPSSLYYKRPQNIRLTHQNSTSSSHNKRLTRSTSRHDSLLQPLEFYSQHSLSRLSSRLNSNMNINPSNSSHQSHISLNPDNTSSLSDSQEIFENALPSFTKENTEITFGHTFCKCIESIFDIITFIIIWWFETISLNNDAIVFSFMQKNPYVMFILKLIFMASQVLFIILTGWCYCVYLDGGALDTIEYYILKK